jgi:hypothetical protein
LCIGSGNSKLFTDVTEPCSRGLVLVEAEDVNADADLVEDRGSESVGPVGGGAPPGLVSAFLSACVSEGETCEDALAGIEFGKTPEDAVLVLRLVVDLEVALIAIEVIAG